MNPTSHTIREVFFIQQVEKAISTYFQYGARSSKKVNCIHGMLHKLIQYEIQEKNLPWVVKEEQKVDSINASGNKKCDLVVFDEKNNPIYVFPVKFIMTNYKQNKNNSWENLTGETVQLKWANPTLNIVPINITLSKIPYLKSGGKIKYYEKIEYQNSFNVSEELVKRGICSSIINIILCVEQTDEIDENYNTLPTILGFSVDTPFPKYFIDPLGAQ